MAAPRIFISHSNHDNAWCRSFAADLRSAGFDEWYDETDMLAGQPFPAIIAHEIETREVFIVALTPAAMASYWVNLEINLALTTQRHIIPIMLEQTSVGRFLRSFHQIDVQNLSQSDVMQIMVRAVEAKFGRLITPSGPTLPKAIPRRFPVYILADCSASMAGAPMVALDEGMALIYRELMSDPGARETVYISLIRFASTAAQDPLEPIDTFVPQTLSASGKCALGAAFKLLLASIQEDLTLRTQDQRGDYSPLVFLLSNGKATDNWKEPLDQLRALRGQQKPAIFAFGCGDSISVNITVLSQITTIVRLMRDVSPDVVRDLLRIHPLLSREEDAADDGPPPIFDTFNHD
jgi:uncharacterized protein YegL